MDICVFHKLYKTNQGVTFMIDFSVIKDFTWTFFKQFLLGFFQSYEIFPA